MVLEVIESASSSPGLKQILIWISLHAVQKIITVTTIYRQLRDEISDAHETA